MKDSTKNFIQNTSADIGAAIFEGNLKGESLENISISAIVAIFKNAGIFICEKRQEIKDEKKRKQCIDEKTDIYNIMLTSPYLNGFDSHLKFKYVDLACEFLKEVGIDRFETVTVNDLYNKIYEEVSSHFNIESTQKLITKIISRGIIEKYKELSLDDARRFETDSLIEFVDHFDNIEKKVLSKNKITEVIEQCANRYIEPLYLHSDNNPDNAIYDECVNLYNLYVDPDIKKLGEVALPAIEYLKSTVFKESPKPMLLFGDAGSGKTSLILRLAYTYYSSEKSEEKHDIFDEHDFVIVRLRYIKKSNINLDGLYQAICDYLNLDSERNPFERKFVILDGMDEISVNNYNTDYDYVLNNIKEQFKDAYKLIITSRPGIINNHDFTTDWDVFSIIPFDSDKKAEWIKRYEQTTKTVIEPKINEYIMASKGNGDKTVYSKESSDIFDYPLLMYMIASATPEEGEWSIDNMWSVYHNIFFNEILERKYENDNQERVAQGIKNALYHLLQRIAYEMYISGSEYRLDKSIIEELTSELNDPCFQTRKDVESAFQKYGYRFGCYWKVDDNDLEVEFYHNYIRDFFISEYIYNHLNKIFENISRPRDLMSYKPQQCEIVGKNGFFYIGRELYNLIRGKIITEKVFEFLALRTAFKDSKEHKKRDEEESFARFLKRNLIDD